jgi:hypothetical protein
MPEDFSHTDWLASWVTSDMVTAAATVGAQQMLALFRKGGDPAGPCRLEE